jgi:acyl-coenzyme A synthetase/AMP-(fatty) acid ligase
MRMTSHLNQFLAGPSSSAALISERETLTFAALRERVEARAEDLFRAPGKQLIFSFLPNGVELATIYLSAITAGHAIGLFPPGTPAHRARGLIEAYQPEIVFTASSELDQSLAGAGYHRAPSRHGGERVPPWRRAPSAASRPEPALRPELALLLSTSGSTGTPKLVRLSIANVAANAAGIAKSLSMSADWRAITSVPLCYSYGLSVLTSHLAEGASVVVTNASPLTPRFWSLARSHEVTEINGTPALYHSVFRKDFAGRLPSTIRVMAQAGGRLPRELTLAAADWMTDTGGRFFCMYGQTEATSRITCLDLSRFPDKLGSVGLPLAGGRVQVDTTPPGMPAGLIRYSGPNVMMGYATSRADLSRGPLVDVLETGDHGHLDADGFLHVAGRASRFVKILDHRVSLDDVEEWFGMPGRCAAIAGQGPGPAITVFTTASPGELRAPHRSLADTLGIPRPSIDIRQVSAIPGTVNGKVDYALLARVAGEPG